MGRRRAAGRLVASGEPWQATHLAWKIGLTCLAKSTGAASTGSAPGPSTAKQSQARSGAGRVGGVIGECGDGEGQKRVPPPHTLRDGTCKACHRSNIGQHDTIAATLATVSRHRLGGIGNLLACSGDKYPPVLARALCIELGTRPRDRSSRCLRSGAACEHDLAASPAGGWSDQETAAKIVPALAVRYDCGAGDDSLVSNSGECDEDDRQVGCFGQHHVVRLRLAALPTTRTSRGPAAEPAAATRK